MPCRTGQLPYQSAKTPPLYVLRDFSRSAAPSVLRAASLSKLKTIRHFASSGTATKLKAVPKLPDWDINTFRERAFVPRLPALLPQDASRQPPASQSWFTGENKAPFSHVLRYDYLSKYGEAIVPLELTRKDEDTGTDSFERFNAPLSLFLDWMQQQAQQTSNLAPSSPTMSPRLYLAQCQIASLPSSLQSDLPAPSL